MYNNNIRTDSEIHQFINSEFRNDRLRLEWPLHTGFLPISAAASKPSEHPPQVEESLKV